MSRAVFADNVTVEHAVADQPKSNEEKETY